MEGKAGSLGHDFRYDGIRRRVAPESPVGEYDVIAEKAWSKKDDTMPDCGGDGRPVIRRGEAPESPVGEYDVIAEKAWSRGGAVYDAVGSGGASDSSAVREGMTGRLELQLGARSEGMSLSRAGPVDSRYEVGTRVEEIEYYVIVNERAWGYILHLPCACRLVVGMWMVMLEIHTRSMNGKAIQGWHTKSFSNFNTMTSTLHTTPLDITESSPPLIWGSEFWDEERDTNTIDEEFDLLSLFTPTADQRRANVEEIQLHQSYYLGVTRRKLLLMLSSGGLGALEWGAALQRLRVHDEVAFSLPHHWSRILWSYHSYRLHQPCTCQRVVGMCMMELTIPTPANE
jgi:hypothetical protein